MPCPRRVHSIVHLRKLRPLTPALFSEYAPVQSLSMEVAHMFEIHGKRIPSTLAELVDPKHTALLLWDMENAIAPNAVPEAPAGRFCRHGF